MDKVVKELLANYNKASGGRSPRKQFAGEILNYITRISRAEAEGRLKEELENVKEELKACKWIYEYNYLLQAIQETENKLDELLSGGADVA